MPAGGSLVLGIGNPHRGDDGAGPAVARALRGRLPPGVRVLERGGDAMALAGLLGRAGRAWMVDACVPGTVPGTIRRFDLASDSLPPASLGLSSHGSGMPEGLELVRILGRLPRPCILYAIEAGSAVAGRPLTPSVAAAVRDVADLICAEVEKAEEQNHPR